MHPHSSAALHMTPHLQLDVWRLARQLLRCLLIKLHIEALKAADQHHPHLAAACVPHLWLCIAAAAAAADCLQLLLGQLPLRCRCQVGDLPQLLLGPVGWEGVV